MAAQRLCALIEDRFDQEFGASTNLKPCVSFKVAPESTSPFISGDVWPTIADDLVKAVREAGFNKAGPILMGSPAMRARALLQEHVQSFRLSDNVFSRSNYVTTRATFDEAAFLRIIKEKNSKTYVWDGKIWLLVHVGETGTSWPSTSLAKVVVHEHAASALAASCFERMLVFDNYAVASLQEDGRYDVYPRSIGCDG